MAANVYQALPLGSRDIRVIELTGSTGQQHDPLNVTLRTISLDNDPRFHALSYSWDDQRPDRPMTCNGSQILITRNCESAIRDLKRSGKYRMVWIDAICIDQCSVPEKNVQVPLMADIYGKATRVLIWLGAQTAPGRIALQHLTAVAEIVSNGNNSETDNRIRAEISRFEVSSHQQYSGLPAMAVSNPIMTEIIKKTWFTRTWTIQEVLLAKEAMLLCGDIELPWKSFLSALKTLSRLEGNSNDGNGLDLNYGVVFAGTAIYRKLDMLIQQPQAVEKFGTVLREVRPKGAGNPMDKVYGVYALLRKMGVGNLPRVDYDLSSQEVYTEATRACINHDGALSILRQLGLPTTLQNLPSWAPDLSNTFPRTAIPVATHLDATRSSQALFGFIPGNRLLLRGVIVDSVDAVPGERVAYSLGDDADESFELAGDRASLQLLIAMQMVDAFQSWLRCATQQPTHPSTNEPSLDAFCKTLCFEGVTGDAVTNWQPEFFLDHFQDWLSIIRASEPSNETGMSHLRQQLASWESTSSVRSHLQSIGAQYDLELETASDAALIVLALNISRAKLFHGVAFHNALGRAFFTTTIGFTGLGPTDVRQGESIALFSGLKVPMVIRSEGNAWRLVGPAFVYGIMHGELWPDSESGLTEFTII